MQYYTYEFAHAMLTPARFMAKAMKGALEMTPPAMGGMLGPRSLSASLEFFETATRRYGKPEFGISETRIHGLRVPVREEIVVSKPFCNLLHFDRERERGGEALRPQGAAHCADVGALRDAVARHRRGDDPGAQSLHHGLERCAGYSCRCGEVRSRRLHRLHHRVPAVSRTQYPRHSRLSAVGAGACRGCRDGCCQGSGATRFADTDGRADRYPAKSDGGQQTRRRAPDRVGSSATSSTMCRCPMRALCGGCIRGSSSCRAS